MVQAVPCCVWVETGEREHLCMTRVLPWGHVGSPGVLRGPQWGSLVLPWGHVGAPTGAQWGTRVYP